MIEFEYQGKKYQARARQMVKHWLVYINEEGTEKHTVTEWPSEGLDEATALKKGILAFFGKEVS